MAALGLSPSHYREPPTVLLGRPDPPPGAFELAGENGGSLDYRAQSWAEGRRIGQVEVDEIRVGELAPDGGCADVRELISARSRRKSAAT